MGKRSFGTRSRNPRNKSTPVLKSLHPTTSFSSLDALVPITPSAAPSVEPQPDDRTVDRALAAFSAANSIDSVLPDPESVVTGLGTATCLPCGNSGSNSLTVVRWTCPSQDVAKQTLSHPGYRWDAIHEKVRQAFS